MDTGELRELLLGRLYIEEQLFRDSMLHRDKKTIMEEAYKIETFANLYEILVEQMEQLSEETLRKLLGAMSIPWTQKVELFSQHSICRENYFYAVRASSSTCCGVL